MNLKRTGFGLLTSTMLCASGAAVLGQMELLPGADVAILIGRHGQTIDAVQYLLNAISHRSYGDERKEVIVDAAGYRERRRATLELLAVRTAQQVRTNGVWSSIR